MYNGSEDRVQYWQARSQSGEIIWLQMEYRFAFAAEMHLFRFNSGGQPGRASGTATSHTSTWSSTWIYSPRYIMFKILYRHASDIGILCLRRVNYIILLAFSKKLHQKALEKLFCELLNLSVFRLKLFQNHSF